MWGILLLGLVVVGVVSADPCVDPDPGILDASFPDGFIWGTATSAYQYEGAWNLSGKGENIWDRFYHSFDTLHGINGDIACDGFHKWEQDVQLLQELGFPYYRLSISWSRIFPTGRLEDGINEEGLRFYRNIFQTLQSRSIRPIVTLNHMDLPQGLEDQGGWLNPDSAVWFEEYADFCFKTFGDMVSIWATVNQPVFQSLGYIGPGIAPGKNGDLGTAPYQVVHNMIRAHVKAWRVYDSKYRSAQKGEVGIVVHVDGFFPKTPKDVTAMERSSLFNFGRVLEPMLGDSGDYPEPIKTLLEGKKGNATRSRLPSFTAEEKRLNQGATDFVGVNIYGGVLVSEPKLNDTPTSGIPFVPSNLIDKLSNTYFTDLGVIQSYCPQWEKDLIGLHQTLEAGSFRCSAAVQLQYPRIYNSTQDPILIMK